jgi:T5SS/PEP-CTERM-associated repeat protein
VDGTGTLEVAGGGTVESYLGSVGLGPNSQGTVTVTGPDSAWVNAPQSVAAEPGERGEMMVGA